MLTSFPKQTLLSPLFLFLSLGTYLLLLALSSGPSLFAEIGYFSFQRPVAGIHERAPIGLVGIVVATAWTALARCIVASAIAFAASATLAVVCSLASTTATLCLVGIVATHFSALVAQSTERTHHLLGIALRHFEV